MCLQLRLASRCLLGLLESVSLGKAEKQFQTMLGAVVEDCAMDTAAASAAPGLTPSPTIRGKKPRRHPQPSLKSSAPHNRVAAGHFARAQRQP